MIFFSPEEGEVALQSEVSIYAGKLNAVEGKNFFLLPIANPREAIPWILASFQSRLAVVPYPENLPEAALERLKKQLPADQVIAFHELPVGGTLHRSKPLSDIWAVIFSSGSTGDPKGIALSGHALKTSALAHAAHPALDGNAWLLNLPLFHVGGFSVISRAHFLGTKVAVGSAKFSVEETWRWVNSRKVGGLSLVPTALRRLLGGAPGKLPLSLKMILVGGAPMPADLLEQAITLSMPVFRTYGMTEHCSQIATETATGSGMTPLPGVKLKVTSAGEICVASDCLASGIFRNGIFTPLLLHDGYFATGDVGEFKDGHLAVKGRVSDLILSGGINIYPLEIESELNGYPGLKDFAVIGLSDREWGEAVSLAIVSEAGEFDVTGLLNFLRTRLDPRKIPKYLVRLDEIPRSALGKLRRAELQNAVEKKILAGG